MVKKLAVLIIALALLVVGIAMAATPEEACPFTPAIQELPPPVTSGGSVSTAGMCIGYLAVGKSATWDEFQNCSLGESSYNSHLNARGTILYGDENEFSISPDGLDLENTMQLDLTGMTLDITGYGIPGSGVYQETVYTKVCGPIDTAPIDCAANRTAIGDMAYEQVGGMFESVGLSTQSTVSNYPSSHNTMMYQALVGPSTQGTTSQYAKGVFTTTSITKSIIGDGDYPTVVNGTISPTVGSQTTTEYTTRWVGDFVVTHQFSYNTENLQSLQRAAALAEA